MQVKITLPDWQKSRNLVNHATSTCVGKQVLSRIDGLSINWHNPPKGTIWQYLPKLKLHLPTDPLMPFSGIYHTHISACL